jgi:hypothetical protein
MDWLDSWKLLPPLLVALDRLYALWRRSRPHRPDAPLARIWRLVGRGLGAYAVCQIQSATKDVRLSAQSIQIEARDQQITALKTENSLLKQLLEAASPGSLRGLPGATPPNGIERRLGPSDRRKTPAAN